MKRALLLSLAFFAALSTLPGQATKIRSCGLHGDHPCHCINHVEKVQKEAMDACLLAHIEDRPTDAIIECLKQRPLHCTIVEHYGNWMGGTDEEGNHLNPMPEQCTMACSRAHCKCSDGPTCHFAHSPEEDK